MANPRQRRKSRSSSYKPVAQSLRSRKNKQNKMPAIRGPKVLQDAWDKTKTVRQNYAPLGLMHNLNPSSSGGVEIDPRHLPSKPAEITSVPEEEVSHSALRKGYGRIIRDGAGNVVDVEVANDEDDSATAGARVGAVDAAEEWHGIGAESDWVKTLSGPEHHDADTGILAELEQLAASSSRQPRFTSGGERKYLAQLVAKYGSDVEAMSKDRRLNAEQKTAGELARAIRKAGGFDRLGS